MLERLQKPSVATSLRASDVRPRTSCYPIGASWTGLGVMRAQSPRDAALWAREAQLQPISARSRSRLREGYAGVVFHGCGVTLSGTPCVRRECTTPSSPCRQPLRQHGRDIL